MRDLGGKYKGFKLLETDEEAQEALERAQNAPPSPPTHFPKDYQKSGKSAKVLPLRSKQ